MVSDSRACHWFLRRLAGIALGHVHGRDVLREYPGAEPHSRTALPDPPVGYAASRHGGASDSLIGGPAVWGRIIRGPCPRRACGYSDPRRPLRDLPVAASHTHGRKLAGPVEILRTDAKWSRTSRFALCR